MAGGSGPHSTLALPLLGCFVLPLGPTVRGPAAPGLALIQKQTKVSAPVRLAASLATGG